MSNVIRQVFFFEDYGTIARCVMESKLKNQRVNEFIVECTNKYLCEQGDTNAPYKSPQKLWAGCRTQAQKENLSIAVLIEKSCKLALGEVVLTGPAKPQITVEKKKGIFSSWDLNEGVEPRK